VPRVGSLVIKKGIVLIVINLVTIESSFGHHMPSDQSKFLNHQLLGDQNLLLVANNLATKTFF
jgi:hypothetical protein